MEWEISCFKCGRRRRKAVEARALKRERPARLNCQTTAILVDIYMGESSAELAGLDVHELVIWRWFRSQGVAEAGATRAVRLLDRTLLLKEPRPARLNRRGQFGAEKRCRYFWYCHAAKILGWCERKQFPSEIRDILRCNCFPSPTGEDEEACKNGPTSVDTNGHGA